MKLKLLDLTSTDDLKQKSLAEATARILVEKYPAHNWTIGWQGGSIWFKNKAISDEFGMWLHPEMSATFSEYKDKVVRFAGELLERAHMVRGAWKGNQAVVLEGLDADAKFKFDLERR